MTAAPPSVVEDGRPPSSPVKPRALRLDIEGLRAVAVLSVLVYHAGIAALPGGFAGVDIFFVISGFLITSLLVKEAQKTGRISLASFYARRARRLLPAATVVLAASAVGTAVLFTGSEARAFGGDIAAAAANLVNWRFAERSIDYLAEDTGQSPVLHFWSLAVEEQFYIVWPLLVIVALLIARRTNRSMLLTMGVGLGIIAALSFAASLVLAQTDPARSFFVTTTRMWELAIGAAVALALPWCARMSDRLASVMAGLGVAAILASLVVVNDGMAWPGSAAALPVLGTGAVIAAGAGRTDTWAARLLSLKPLVWIGGLSYSLYLWHWPLLIFAEQYRGHLGVTGAVAVSAAAVIPAYLSQRFIENPIRYSRRRLADRGRMLLLGALLVALGVIAGLVVVLLKSPSTVDSRGMMGSESLADPGALYGAHALGVDPLVSPEGDPAAPQATIYPDPADAVEDVPEAYELGCQVGIEESEPNFCVIGDTTAKYQIVAVGDSKLIQYYEPLDLVGKRFGWRIEIAAKSGCSFIEDVIGLEGNPYDSCTEFGQRVQEHIDGASPEVVLVGNGAFDLYGEAQTSHDDRAQALAEKWETLVDAGYRVVVLIDNPYPHGVGTAFECVEANVS
ncbi:MAG: acyltransferase family protein, partial [Demequina sp.]